MDLNKVMIIGRLTRDPESRTTPQGVTVTNMGVATSRVWKDQQGNQQENTEFHNVVAWRRLGEICAQYLSKGRQVYIEGHLQTRSWDDQQSGQKRYRTEIVADNLIMLGSKGDGPANNQYNSDQQRANAAPQQQQQEPAMAAAPAGSDEEIRIEDIPF
jgi:single-strand DNA-binding protein